MINLSLNSNIHVPAPLTPGWILCPPTPIFKGNEKVPVEITSPASILDTKIRIKPVHRPPVISEGNVVNQDHVRASSLSRST